MKQKLFSLILLLLFILLSSLAVILYGRGYRVDLKRKSFKTTGLLAATSTPPGASVFVNGRLLSATNDTLNLEPGWYQVRLVKEGYLPWEKKIEIKAEVVAETKATLFPKNPSLVPLTSTGVKAPSLSPDGGKIAYVIPYQLSSSYQPSITKYGVFILDLNSYPFPFSKKPRQVFSKKILPDEEVRLLWSPTSDRLLLLSKTYAFLLDINKRSSSPTNLIGTLPSLFSSWKREKEELEKRKLLSLPEPLMEVITSSAKILAFSPNEAKILYQATASAKIPKIITPPFLATNPTKETREIEPNKIYVYDRKEDRNYLINEKVTKAKSLLQGGRLEPELSGGESHHSSDGGTEQVWMPLQWLPTSRHLILTEEGLPAGRAGKISILEYDGTNKATIYTGKLEENFVAPFPNGEKLVILTTLNPAAQTLPNLYTLSLR